MRIVEPGYKVLTPFGELTASEGVSILRFVERMARISHKSEDLQTSETWRKFLTSVVLERGDWSVTEHASFTVIFRVDRGISHELVRHRLFGFTQESTRFVNYEKKGGDLEFIYPAGAPDEQPPFPAISDGPGAVIKNPYWEECIRNAERNYLYLLKIGWRPQEARSVLPNALATTIAVTGNLRNWRHALLMRTTKETHPDFRRVTIPLLEELKNKIPLIYDDIEPMARQIDNLRKGR